MDDVLYTVDGRAVGRLDPVFKADFPIREAQLVQESLDRVRVIFVPAEGFQRAVLDGIADALRARLGPVSVCFEEAREIARGANGKFRAVVCRVPREHLPAAVAPN